MLRWRCFFYAVTLKIFRWWLGWGGGGDPLTFHGVVGWGPAHVPCDTPMIANDATLMMLRPSLEWVQSIHSEAAQSQSGLIELYTAACQWRYINGQTGKPWHITLQNTQLLPSGYYIYPHWWENKQRTNLPIQGLLSIYHESAQLYPPQTLVAPHSCKPTYPSYPMKYQQMYNGKMPILLTKSTKSSFWLVKQRSPYPDVIQYVNFALQQS